MLYPISIQTYDRPMLDVIGTDLEEKNRNTLKGFYGTFKAADASLRFVLLTGVTKFSQISVFSGFKRQRYLVDFAVKWIESNRK